MNKLPVAAGLALALVAGSALAADLPSRKGPPVYVPPAFSWTGLYGGINIGYGFGAGGADQGYLTNGALVGAWNTGSSNLNGVLGGGQVGYNYQFNSWLVVGLESDIQASDVHGQSNAFLINSAKSVDWFGTVRARVGVTLPGWSNVLIYGTGGFAYGQVDHTVASSLWVGNAGTVASGKYFQTTTGYAAGGGVEWSPLSFPAWSVKIEYLYTDLGSTTVPLATFAVGGAAQGVFVGRDSSPTRFHTVRAGLNWHFNPFASGAVLAKY